MTRLIALTCEALARTLYAVSATSPNTVSIRLFRQGLHNTPKNLRSTLQEQIDSVKPGECDTILLVYGICGRSTIGLEARHTPLVIPRAHDCITLYLGSRQRYQEEFDKHPGTYWYSVDYMERQEKGSNVALGSAGIEADQETYEKYIAKYGQETADMLMEELRQWSKHYTRAAFIDMGLGGSDEFEQMARKKAEKEGWNFERFQGNRRLLEMLVNGQWSEEDFLIVPPGHAVQQAYDDKLVCAVQMEPSDQPIA